MQDTPPESFRYYIASSLDNADQVRSLKAKLDAAGWEHTYDWTVHGSVQREGAARLAEVADDETDGVLCADVVIVLLPGGRGTHTELGMAVAMAALDPDDEDRMRVCIVGDVGAFNPNDGTTCAFYFHRVVERFTSIEAFLAVTLGVEV